MKLIDLLVKKTNEEGWVWPGKSTFCYQTKPEHGYITKFFDRNGVKVVDYCWEKCDDASVFNELTKEQYENALAASDDRLEQDLNECIGASEAQVWNGDGVPTVGMRCEYQWAGDEWKKGKICYISKQTVLILEVFEGEESESAFGVDDVKFRPLRTEAGKASNSAVDAMQDYFPRCGWDYDDICSLYDAIAEGKIPGVKLETK